MLSSSVLQPMLASQAHREAGDAIAMTAGVRVFGVDGGGECPHDAAEELGLLVVEGDVAAVNAEDRGHARHQAGFDGAELDFAVGDVAGAGVIERQQPAEEVIAFADRHGDDLADAGIEPGRRAGGARLSTSGSVATCGPSRSMNWSNSSAVERAIAVLNEHAACVRLRISSVLIVLSRSIELNRMAMHLAGITSVSQWTDSSQMSVTLLESDRCSVRRWSSVISSNVLSRWEEMSATCFLSCSEVCCVASFSTMAVLIRSTACGCQGVRDWAQLNASLAETPNALAAAVICDSIATAR